MLYNSYSFILLYLPIVFFGMFYLGRHIHRLAALWLGFASLIFYAMWDARFVILLISSITFNYGAGYLIGSRQAIGAYPKAKLILITAITANLALLGYFKYTNFFIESINALAGHQLTALNIILPLGISLFTITQIAFLINIHHVITHKYKFILYLLFVTYFPLLIACPLLHFKQMMTQFSNPSTYRINA